MTKKKDEDKLRKRLVNALNNRLTKKGDPEQIVQDVHGINEYGLDIIFLARDFSGELRCFGMQLKAGNLTCRSSPTKGVKEIIGQLAIANGGEYKRQPDNKYEFSGFYVVVEGEISETAKKYICSAFHQGKPIYFLCGENLDNFLKTYELKSLTEE